MPLKDFHEDALNNGSSLIIRFSFSLLLGILNKIDFYASHSGMAVT